MGSVFSPYLFSIFMDSFGDFKFYQYALNSQIIIST